jgi:potassium channel
VIRFTLNNIVISPVPIVIVLQYLKEKKGSPAIAAVAEEMEDMLARGQLELPVTVYFAASKGDDYLIHQLLKRGHDPNDSDTALVMKVVWID